MLPRQVPRPMPADTLRPRLVCTLVQKFGAASLADEGEELGDGLPVEGDVVDGHYRLVHELGVGMFGRVYVAERTDVPEHRVALKVVHRAVYGGRNVDRELTMLAAATHPNIVQLKDHGQTDRYVWLTMPLYQGETLAERLDRSTLTLREAYEIFVPIARGLEALHERGLRHQDVKPENIFLAEFSGRLHPVLLDLGVAVESSSAFVAGTALYAAPEQLIALGGMDGKALLSEKMDVYCLAATLLRALVGSSFFAGECAQTPYDIACAYAEREKRPVPSGAMTVLGGEPRRHLIAAMSRWLRRDPEERPTAGRMARELDVLLEQEHEAARAIEAGIARQKLSLQRVRVALAAVAVVATGVGLWGYSKRETLRMAAELERARAAGEASYGELGSCLTARREASETAERCAADLADTTERHGAAVTALRDADAEREGCVERLGAARGELRSCEDESRRASESFATDRARFETTVAERDTALALERSEHERLDAEITRLDGEKKRVAAEHARLVDEHALLVTAHQALQALHQSVDDSRRRCETSLVEADAARQALRAELSKPPVCAAPKAPVPPAATPSG
jgi:eukaryotic-like serine/threonine-protein kinase